MKNQMTKVLSALTLLLTAVTAHAYVSNAPDPTRGEGETEYRVVKKSETAGVSDAISRGDILSLDLANNNDGYTVTRVGANNAASTNRVVCIASKAVATGDTGLVRCVSKGYVDYLSYNASSPILQGTKLCVNGAGQAVRCAGCTVNDADPVNTPTNCMFGSATQNSPITSLEYKQSGSGTDLKALINAK